MLLEFACSNHKSIRKEILFSTLASKDTTYADRTYAIAGNKVLKSAVIYGANGSGKSNFVDAIAFVKNLVLNSIRHGPGQGIAQHPHKLEGFIKESSYRIQFVTNNVRYVFGFSLKNMLVSNEYLYYFPNNRQTKIFERSEEKVSVGSKFKGKFLACKDVLKPNRLFLSCAANFSSVAEVEATYAFFNNELIIYGLGSQDNWMNYSVYMMNSHPQLKAAVLAFLNDLDTGIKDINVSIKKKKLEAGELPPFLSDEFKNVLLKNNVDTISAKVRYEQFETDLLQEESAGIKKLFAILCPFIDIIVNGKVLICDELESGLHEAIMYGLLKLFINTPSDKFAQLILTSHETGLLNLELFRRDQIWFTELTKEDRATDLYSLAEIKSVRKEENFAKGYIAGRYGAIPMLNLNFADIVAKI
ncbi:MAG: ATP-binding protein [Succinivibrio sp.]|nr:ATP-binding protein [Succinivibrio sp.]